MLMMSMAPSVRSVLISRIAPLVALGRAYLYAGKFAEAHAVLELVPAGYWHGASKILDAAALIDGAKAGAADESSTELQVKRLFSDGYSVDSAYWDGIFSGKRGDIHLTYNVPVELLKSIYNEETGRKL
jgi:hypothetical protein